jgi:type IV pilus assembly protein PilC
VAIFNYKAQRENGDVYEGSAEANSRFDIYAIVRNEGSTILEIKEKSSFSVKHAYRKANSFLSTVKESEKIILARNVATMIKAGLSLSRSIDVMERQSKNPKLKAVLAQVREDINGGSPLHKAIERHPRVFPPLFVAMVKAGEESGKLAEALTVVARQMEHSYELKKKIRGAMIYPSIIVIAMIGIGILMLIYVVPTLSQTFAELNAELPLSTRIIIGTSNFLANNIVLSLASIVAVVVGLMAAARTRRGRVTFDFVLLHMPIISGLVREANAARTARTLSSLLSAGVEVLSALSITGEVLQNSYYKTVIQRAQEEVRSGNPIADVFIERSDIYPVMMGDMMAVGEETGQLAEMLERIAEFFEEDVSQRTKDLSTIIEPFLMIVIGSVVGFFAISMIAPIYSISESI